MAKVMLTVAVTALAGCASMGKWRDLSIDGSSEARFGESLALINDELSHGRRQMFALALVDIAQTDYQQADQTADGNAYTLEDYRNRLDGLTYAGVIALADQTGIPTARLYSASLRTPLINDTRNTFSSDRPAPVGDDRLSGVNSGLILSDAWKEPGFSPSDFRYP